MIYYIPPINLLGKGCLKDLVQPLKNLKCKKAFVVSDKFLTNNGTVEKVTNILKEANLEFTVYNDVKPNPTVTNVENGYKILVEEKCDIVITIGGGSPQDCGKAIAVLATNGGSIKDYEGINKTSNKSLPIVAITTTAGTSAEVTINYVITDEERHVKMIMVDTNSLAAITVNDPELMLEKPAALTAATGMDALTHAMEGYTTKAAWLMTDMFHLKAIEIISRSLRSAVANEKEGREGMALGQYIAGMGFSNVGLGIAHSMAHTLGAVYDTPHGVACAMMLPIVMEYNAECTGEKYREIARAMGVKGVDDMSVEEYRKAAIDAVQQLSVDVGIPTKLEALKEEDLEFLAESAFADACAPGNPKDTNVEDLKALFRKLM